MRDTFENLNLPADESEPDPVKRAQKQMRAPLPKRFYANVETCEAEGGGYMIQLDGRSLRTPAKSLLAVPSRALGEAIADEWRAQIDVIDPSRMPLTRIANTAIDGVASDPQAVAEDIVRFSASDLLCYRAGEPEGLVARQGEHWDPMIDWARSALGARFMLAEGVIHVEQPREAIAAFSAHVGRFSDPLQLAAIHTMTTLTGSAILALAVACGEISAEDAWKAAHVDEDWNIELWGEDAEAAGRRQKRWEEMKAAATAVSAL